ncbi:MAG: hypothetical protein AAGN35_12565 [Bacteroidota bacterium]
MINLQIESRFKEFFGVLTLHSYYNDLVTRDLEFEPTPETVQLLRNYQLVFKQLPFGFLVLFHPDYSPPRLASAPKGLRFSFRVKNMNARFMNFSRIPFWPEGVAFHYSNQGGHKADIDLDVPRDVYYYFKQLKVAQVEKKLLHLPEEHALVPLRPRRFSLNISDDSAEAGVSYDELVIRDEFNSDLQPGGAPYKKKFRNAFRHEYRRYLDHETRSLRSENISRDEYDQRFTEISNALEQRMSAERRSSVRVDLSHVPFGKYSLEAGKRGKYDFYVAEDSTGQQFGMVDIYLETPVDALLNRDAELDSVVNPQIYYLNYEARPTYWRYFFLNYKKSKIAPAGIREENESLEFTPPQEGFVESVGARAFISESTIPLELKDRPQYTLYLDRILGQRNMKEMRLPLPNADMVKPVRSASGEKIYSDIFVYL